MLKYALINSSKYQHHGCI